MGLVKEFKAFAIRGNVVDMAVGIMVGAAFSTIVSTLVDKVFMPPIGMMLGRVDFSDYKIVLKEGIAASQGVAAVPEVAIYYGEAINAIIKFAIVAIVLFFIVKMMNELREAMEQEAQVAPPKQAPADIKLLTEIRDLLQQQNAQTAPGPSSPGSQV